MQQAVIFSNISKDFPLDGRKIRVLDNISSDIRLGEMTMLVGPSGCGKTTLISILSGILSTTEGRVDIMGAALTDMPDTKKVLFRRKNIGFIFQQYNLLPALSAAENAAIPLTAAGVSNKKALARARALLEGMGMEGQTEKLPRQLSGGQQQRVAIARSLVHNPKLIICDEPTAALDAKTGLQVMQILRDIANEKNRAVLVVTHDNRIFHFGDRILEMSDGRITGDYTTEDFLKKEHIE
ncbi:MAG: ABC transporter ATP-binding protein [Rhodospirillales bacterium]|nr:ABC transporter ATP-binding protein [Alphaproteobacteria bacterium]MCB9981755.1 ABC transporter ATP-binding protein [Rhodospirillales bacterium]